MSDTTKPALPEPRLWYDPETRQVCNMAPVDPMLEPLWAEDDVRAAIDAAVAELKDELEIERMRLAACGVVAMSNTRESAAQQRQMKPEYWCASVQDVAKAVDREIDLRERLDAAVAEARAVPEGWNVRKVDPGFRWSGDTQEHIPQVLVEFEPVPANAPNDAPGWLARDAFVAALAATPSPAEQPKPVAREYAGVSCMCVVTGCRAGPGCPHYSSHCKKHIAALSGEQP